MNKFHIRGPSSLNGEVLISGSKNAALPILFSSLLTEESVNIYNVPKLKDVDVTIKLLRLLGSQIEYQDILKIDNSNIKFFYIPNKLVKKIRASIWLLAPLISRFGVAKIFVPGGCIIGERPIDLHISGLTQLGTKFIIKKKYIKASTNGRLRGAHIIFKKISVGATITIMMAATLAKGETIIENAACEPEIVDTANFLNILGAKIYHAGNKKIIIQGVQRLGGGNYTILPDRIETGTFLVGAAISGGNILCKNTQPNLLVSVLSKLKYAGAHITIGHNWINLEMNGKRPQAVHVQTSPYPGFPTDMQPQFTVLNLVAKGSSIIQENIFENRFLHIPELMRMGANVVLNKNIVVCYGVPKLFGTSVLAQDLRSSASLVLAGCIAYGTTLINNISHIDRGYEFIENKLNLLGAKIQRISNNI